MTSEPGLKEPSTLTALGIEARAALLAATYVPKTFELDEREES